MPYKDKAFQREYFRRKSREHYLANRERVLARNRKWEIENPERRKAAKRKWYAKNRDLVLARKSARRAIAQQKRREVQARYRKTHAAEIRLKNRLYNQKVKARRKQHYEANKKQILERMKQYAKQPEIKARNRLNQTIWRAKNRKWLRKKNNERQRKASAALQVCKQLGLM